MAEEGGGDLFFSGFEDEDLEEALEKSAEIKAALANGLRLHDYTEVVEQELRRVEAESVRDYTAQVRRLLYIGDNLEHGQAPRVAELNVHMARCDEILCKMGSMLSDFSGELRGEPDLSRRAQRSNRVAAGSRLEVYLRKVALPSDLEAVLLESEVVDELYCEYLALLRRRIEEFDVDEMCLDNGGLSSSSSSTVLGLDSIREVPSGAAFAARLDSLRGACAARCRDVLVAVLQNGHHHHHHPPTRTRSQLIMVGEARVGVARCAELYDFLARFNGPMAAEVRAAYVGTVARGVALVVQTYAAKLAKFEHALLTKRDLIGATEEGAVSRSMFSGKVLSGARTSIVETGGSSMSRRAEVLEAAFSHEPLRVADLVAPAEGGGDPTRKKPQLAMELTFRSVGKVILEASRAERHVVNHVFAGGPSGGSQEAVDAVLEAIFTRPLETVRDDLERRLHASYDAVGVLLIIRLCRDARRRTRHDPLIDAFFETCADTLCWPRLLEIVQAQADSVRKRSTKHLAALMFSATHHQHHQQQQQQPHKASLLASLGSPVGKRSDRASLSTMATTVGGPAPAVVNVPTTPHYVARRYAELAAGLLALVKKRDDADFYSTDYDDRLVRALDGLHDDVVSLLDVLSQTSPHRLVFLINNYDAIRETFYETAVDGRHFDTLLAGLRNDFVDAEMNEKCATLSDFVQRHHTQAQADGDPPQPDRPVALDAAEVERVARDFHDQWKTVISRMNADILRLFNNFRNGMEILKLGLQRLLRTYSTFLDVVERSWRRAPPFADLLVPTSTILLEIKQYSRTY